MEKGVIQAYTHSVQKEVFDAIGVTMDSLVDLEGFENFVYGMDDRVIRVTHNSHRSKQQLMGELEFLEYLHVSGAAVSRPVAFVGGVLPQKQLVVSVGDFHVCQFERATGVAAKMDEPWSQSVIAEWGRCIGEFHRLTRDFEPRYPRQDWVEDENHQFADRIPANQHQVLEQADALMDRLSTLNDSKTVYGLIHSDAHAGNYVVSQDKVEQDTLTFFDFDDCLYTWYGYDVATILLGVALQPWVDTTQAAMSDAVADFLPVFMEGYSRANNPDCLMWDHMHDFLKLREFSLYGVIHAHMNPDEPEEGFTAKFMRNRRARIEQNLPFVDLDFSVR